ncbi:MAG: DUF2029 domain-containing protein [Actinobacteria bacterium]|nr:DUF2029 domain-containing protein [Actinomycetota bacterium]
MRERFVRRVGRTFPAPLVAVLLVAISLLLRLPAVLGYGGPPAAHPFNVFEMAHVGAYSDIAHLYFRDRLWLDPTPYRDFRFEYPVLTGCFVWLASAVAGGGIATYVLLSAALLAACAAGAVVALRSLPGANPWIFAAAPALAFYGVLNWDLFGVVLMLFALVLIRRGRDAAGGMMLGLATAAKLFPAVALPVAVAIRLVEGRRIAAVRLACAFAGAFAVVNAPFALQASGGLRASWLYFFRFNVERPPRATIWKPLVHAHSNLVTTPLLAAGLVAILVCAIRARHRPGDSMIAGSVASLLWLFGIAKVYSPQYAIWIFAALALVAAPARIVVAFAAIDALVAVTTFGPLYPGFGPFAPHGAPLELQWGAYGLRQVATVVLAAWVVRERLLPLREGRAYRAGLSTTTGISRAPART